MAGKKIPIAALPEGAVTLLLADLEGSTTAWETAPEQMRALRSCRRPDRRQK